MTMKAGPRLEKSVLVFTKQASSMVEGGVNVLIPPRPYLISHRTKHLAAPHQPASARVTTALRALDCTRPDI